MKAIKVNPLKNFSKKSLMKYSKFVDQLMQKRILFFLIGLNTVSCTTQKYYRADFVKLDNKLDGQFYNYPSNNATKNSSVSKITDLLNIKSNDSIVKIKTVKNSLVISFNDDTGKLKHHSYPGDFKNKSFKLYLRYKTTTVPFIATTSKNMEYLRFSVLNDETLVINYEYVNEGMLLFLGAGNSYNQELVYKSLK